MQLLNYKTGLRRFFAVLLCLAILLIGTTDERSIAMIMPLPMNIAKLTDASKLVLKATVVSIQPAIVPKEHPLSSNFWQVCRAKLKVISVLKGMPTAKNIEMLYRCDTPVEGIKQWLDVSANNHAHFKLEPQRSYILFVENSTQGELLMQVSTAYTSRSWEGFFRAADESSVVADITPKQCVWNELTKQLNSQQPDDCRYAAMTLLDCSCNTGNGASGTADFSRATVLDLIFKKHSEPPSALSKDGFLEMFIQTIGSLGPYSRDDYRMRYFWSKADRPMCSWSSWGTADNTTLKPAIPFLIKIADSNHKPNVRAAAILAMGSGQGDRQCAKSISARLPDWLISAVSEVRAAATTLSADYPEKIDVKERIHLMQDAAPQVRKAAALSVGMTQSEQGIPQLEKLLKDRDGVVRAYAALGLVSFPLERTKTMLLAHLNDRDLGLGFLCRVALLAPQMVKSELLSECQKKLTPMSSVPANETQMAFQNGLATDLHRLARSALLKYLDETSGADLAKPEFAKFLDCMQQNAVGDPSLTGAVYQLLIVHGLDGRAVAFKKAAIAAQPALPSIAFEQPERLLQSGGLKRK